MLTPSKSFALKPWCDILFMRAVGGFDWIAGRFQLIDVDQFNYCK